MKCNVPKIRLSKKQKEAMDAEIERQLVEHTVKHEARYDADLEAMVAWVLWKHYGFTLRKLLNFRRFVIEEKNIMDAKYLMGDTYPAKHMLKDIGYDVDALQKQDEETR